MQPKSLLLGGGNPGEGGFTIYLCICSLQRTHDQLLSIMQLPITGVRVVVKAALIFFLFWIHYTPWTEPYGTLFTSNDTTEAMVALV